MHENIPSNVWRALRGHLVKALGYVSPDFAHGLPRYNVMFWWPAFPQDGRAYMSTHWRTGMPVSKGWHMGPFLPLQLPRIIWLMPQLCVVGSRHKPLSIDPPCFPHSYCYLEAAIIQSPCWLEREGRMWDVWWRTIPMLIASGMQGITSWFLLHLSVGEATARS